MANKKAKVLLISPNLVGIKDGITRIEPPMGIGFLAAALLQEGHEVFVRDTALEGWEKRESLEDENFVSIGETENEITEYIRAVNPDIVGISLTFSNLVRSAKEIARMIKSINPAISVVIGGNCVTGASRDFRYARDKSKNPLFETLFTDIFDKNFDYAMTGESDLTFPRLVDCLMNNGNITQFNNLIYRDKKGSIVFADNTSCSGWVDLTKLPLPARQLFNMNKYFEIGAFQSPRTKAKKILRIMATRGCPEQCTFCSTPETWGRKIRWRNSDSIEKEIEAAFANEGVEEIQIADDNITANLSNFYKLCDLLEKTGVPWCTPNGTKANYHMDKQPEYYKRMKESGCYQTTIAGESGNQYVLDNLANKNLQLYEIAKAVDNAKNAGLYVHTYWMVGFPGETREQMEETIAFAASVGADSYSVGILLPLPGTLIYRKVIEENLFWISPGEALNTESKTTRTSLVKIAGFKDAHELEAWTSKQNIMLNELLAKKDPRRFEAYESLRDPKFRGMNIKQT